MHVLVTGGAGYIGAHTCLALHKNGHLPVVIDNLAHGYAWAVKWGPLVHADIRNSAAVLETVKRYEIEAVIHFAGLTLVGESIHQPLKYFDGNFTATAEFLNTLMQTNVRSLIFSSTCAVYGTPDQVPIQEHSQKNPINPYGRAKLAVEYLLESLATSHGLKSISLRYFNAAGADPDSQIGEAHNPETHLIPLAINAALDESYELTVFGTDYLTHDGTCIRDYIHVTDIAEAHLRALAYLPSCKESYSTFNVGVGSGYSVGQVIKEIEASTGQKVKTKLGQRRNGDAPILVADNTKIVNELGWTPVHSSLNEIVETALKWHRRNLHSPN